MPIRARDIRLAIDGVEYSDTVSRASVGVASSIDAFSNGQVAQLAITQLSVTLVQDAAPGSLWRRIVDKTDPYAVNYRLAPNGNTTATAAQPHYAGVISSLTLPEKGDYLGGTASTSRSSALTVDCVWNASVSRVDSGELTD